MGKPLDLIHSLHSMSPRTPFSFSLPLSASVLIKHVAHTILSWSKQKMLDGISSTEKPLALSVEKTLAHEYELWYVQLAGF
jgi:hypothetical protein